MEEYFKRLRVIVHGLGKAVSKSMGFEECYIEKAFKLDSGFDMSAMNTHRMSDQKVPLVWLIILILASLFHSFKT